MKKLLSEILCLAVLLAMLAGCGGGQSSYSIGWIGSSDVLKAGAQEAAAEQNAALVDLREVDLDRELADRIRRAKYHGIRALILAEDSTEITEALQAAVEAGIRLVSVDASTDVETAAAFAMDHRAMGRAAGEAMLAALKTRRVVSGQIAVMSAQDPDPAAMEREAGFREAFAQTSYTLQETRRLRNQPSLARSLAWQLIKNGALGIYGCTPELTEGIGSAARDADAGVVVTGFGQSAEITALLETGGIRMTAAPDWHGMGYEAMQAAIGSLQEEPGTGAAGSSVMLRLESEAPLLRITDYKIALIAADRISSHSRSLAEGAAKAAEELGCQVTDLSPLLPDGQQQAAAIEEAISSGCFAILASGDAEAVAEALAKAAEADMTVVWAEPFGQGSADAFLTMDYRAAGRKAAQILAAELEERGILEGRIGIIHVREEDQEASQRLEGFREVFADRPYTLLEPQYSEGDAARAHAIAEDYLEQEAAGIFCCNRAAAIGAGNAAADWGSEVPILGCGTSEAITRLLEEGWLLESIASDAGALGYEGIRTVCALLGGEDPARLTAGAGVAIQTGEAIK